MQLGHGHFDIRLLGPLLLERRARSLLGKPFSSILQIEFIAVFLLGEGAREL